MCFDTKSITLIILFFVVAVYLLYFMKPKFNYNTVQNRTEEGFFSGVFWPYDYPYYWPLYYNSGCNLDVFDNLTCLPMSANPFW